MRRSKCLSKLWRKEVQTEWLGVKVGNKEEQEVFLTVGFNVKSFSHNGGSHQCDDNEERWPDLNHERFHLLFRRKNCTKFSIRVNLKHAAGGLSGAN